MTGELVHDRDLDAWIGEHIMKLKGVGYYRRESRKNTKWEKCKKGDNAWGDDNNQLHLPTLRAHLYYLQFSDDLSSVFSIPRYTDDMNHALDLILKMRHRGYVVDLASMHGGAQVFHAHIYGCKRPIDSFHTDLAEATDSHPARAICRAAKIAWENSEHWES